jgi:signal transduction histidine kinase
VSSPILTVEIRYEHDVVLARQRARQIAEALGFDRQDQVRLATAVSELARNAFQYASHSKVEFLLTSEQPQFLRARISDQGKGIPNLPLVLSGEYVSSTGMGLGIIGAKRLMDEFQIESNSAGTIVLLGKQIPRGTPRITRAQLGHITQTLAQPVSQDPFAEIQRQNQELLATMAELEKRQKELSQLNRELEDTNRGVVALYAELDQRADHLRRVSESKTKFLSHMTHEFRTPLNSIISLSRILSDHLDGPLTAEQEKQVGFIRRAAGDLSALVDDLLDLAKVEAGKISVRPETFDLESIFASLRGTLRPLLAQSSAVNLVFDPLEDLPPLHTDPAKVSQILRNFVSNALKYTKSGEVRVNARLDDPGHVFISVSDTGIGIAPVDQERVFEEFEQVEGPHQKVAKGTGLGLPLAKKLAELLGGSVHLQSQLGVGSTFSVRLPIRYGEADAAAYGQRSTLQSARILIIDDDEAARYIMRSALAKGNFQIAEATGGKEGLAMAVSFHPNIILLDLSMPDLGGEEVLRRLKENSATASIPVIINTSRHLQPKERAQLAAQTAGIVSKQEMDPAAALRQIHDLLNAVLSNGGSP